MYGMDGMVDEDVSDEEDSEEDALDGLQDPRITEVDSDDEEAPKLVKADKKGKNKRPAHDSDDDKGESLDDLISKATKSEDKAAKKQAKKLKKNDGQATVAAEDTKKVQKDAANGDKKKVQFAKNLEQGPTGSPKTDGAKLGPKVVNGVTIDDKKPGKGPAAKKGDKIEMRYIGKLKDGKVFDCKST
jgi:FK506-binding nuclear protein